jgi:4-azaleucine resistance transporter AzlC
MSSAVRHEITQGIKSEIPIVVGVIPFGLIFGVLAANAGINPWLAWSTSQIIFAGSAQFLAIPLIANGTPALVLVLTTFIINVRHILYSASMAPRARHLSLKWKVVLSFLLTDEAFIPTNAHYLDKTVDEKHKHWFWLGAGMTLWFFWQVSTGLGIFLGAQLPPNLGLEFTLSLTFIGLIVPTLKSRPAVAAALSAGLVAVAAHGLPYRLNLMAAAVAGIATGMILERLLAPAQNTAPASL